jgi:trigger factor
VILSNQQSQFQNENITVLLTQKKGCRIRLDIDVSPKATQAAYSKAVKAINKVTSIPGFRKGKAPEAMIVKNFSKNIETEWKDILLNTAFQEALSLKVPAPFNKKSIINADVKSVSKEEGAKLLVEYEGSPEVPSINIEELQVKPITPREIAENDIENAIKEVSLHHAKWTKVTDRPVAEGDFVTLDIDAIETPVRNICKNALFEVVPSGMATWMRKLVVGMSPEQTVEGMSENPEETCEECVKGIHDPAIHKDFQPTNCRIKLVEIQTAILPEIEDLAKTLGLENGEQLRSKITANIRKEAEEETLNAKRNQMEAQILEKYPFDIPASLVQNQMEEQRQKIRQELSRQHSQTPFEERVKNVEDKVLQKIESDFRLYFLMQKVADEHNITIEKEELTGEWIRQIVLKQKGLSILDDSIETKEIHSRLYAQLLLSKSIDFLIDNAGTLEKT